MTASAAGKVSECTAAYANRNEQDGVRLHSYPIYLDTEEGWIGSIPDHWEKNKFKHLLREKPKTQNAELPCGSISFGQVVYKDSERLTEETRLAYQEVLAGEFLVNPLNLNYDLRSLRTALSEIDVIVSSGYIVLQNRGVGVPAYLKWLLFVFDIRHMKTLGAGIRQTITFKDIGNCTAFLPPPQEQFAISDFLDRETARIDNLIAEKQRFINLLKEKRQALISHVVTKGLDPKAKMKDSGIEWIGEVPEHWVVKKIKHFVASLSQGWSPQCENSTVATEEEWGVLKVGCVNGGVFNPKENKKLPDELDPVPELSLRRGDLLVSRANAREWVGSAAVVQQDFPKLLLCDKIYRIRVDERSADPDFVSSYLGSSRVREQIEIAATGTSSSMLNIGQKTILTLPIAQPPIGEQAAIVDAIRGFTSVIDKLASEARTSIELLREHRTALISAAVTGKIDVRDQQ